MAITFDPANKRIILDSTSFNVTEIWSRWIDWVSSGDNSKYLPALSQSGGEELLPSIFSPIYIFLDNGWRVRPMEANHKLVLDGFLYVRGGGDPVVNTLGAYNVSVQYTVAMQAQAVATSGSSGPTAEQVAAAVHNYIVEAGMSFDEMFKIKYSVLAGKVTGAGTSTESFRSVADNKNRLVVTADEFGNRTGITADGT